MTRHTRVVTALVAIVAVFALAPRALAQTEPGSTDRRQPLVITPGDRSDATRPDEPRLHPGETPPVRYAPAFIAPLSRETATGRQGAAGWISPNPATGSRATGQPDQGGWFGFGFATQWGRGGGPTEASPH